MKSPRRSLRNATRAYAGAGVAAGLVVLSVAQAGAAVAAKPADDAQTAAGTIKIHSEGTAEDDNSNEPKVCAFTLVGDGFDAGEDLTYDFMLGAPFKDAPALSGAATADSAGSWSTAVINLAAGQWKVTVNDGEDEKFKVFKVECEPVDEPVDEPPVDEPVDEPPVDEPVDEPVDPSGGPVDEPPVDEPPVDEPPVDEPPVDEPVDPSGGPVDEPPVDETPGDPPVDEPMDPSGDPVDEPTTNVEVDLPLTPDDDVDVVAVGNPQTVVEDGTVTGTWESIPAELPRTGASANVGVAGLLLVGAGLGLRRAAQSKASPAELIRSPFGLQ